MSKKRKYILYFVVSILCEKINFDEEIIRDSQKTVLSNVLKKIDSIYKQIMCNTTNKSVQTLMPLFGYLILLILRHHLFSLT